MSRLRLDELLAQRGLYPSRARARDAIQRGTVKVDGAVALKPAQNANPESVIEIADQAQKYVSRAALKLKHAIHAFGIEIKGRNCLDLGASTGGFTEVLLEEGASHVTAIDVGHGQFSPKLQGDVRVTSIEGLNARDLTLDHVGHTIDVITCDVSFISLRLALPPALGMAEKNAHLIALIKPQFEVGRDRIGRSGVVTDPSEHERVCGEIRDFLLQQGWDAIGIVPSAIEGGDGNQEFLIAAIKT